MWCERLREKDRQRERGRLTQEYANCWKQRNCHLCHLCCEQCELYKSVQTYMGSPSPLPKHFFISYRFNMIIIAFDLCWIHFLQLAMVHQEEVKKLAAEAKRMLRQSNLSPDRPGMVFNHLHCSTNTFFFLFLGCFFSFILKSSLSVMINQNNLQSYVCIIIAKGMPLALFIAIDLQDIPVCVYIYIYTYIYTYRWVDRCAQIRGIGPNNTRIESITYSSAISILRLQQLGLLSSLYLNFDL